MTRPTWIVIGHTALAFILLTCATLASAEEVSDAELTRMAQNPLANLISVPFQNNTNFSMGPYDRTQNVLNIQPVVPFRDGRLITRTILPVVWQPDLLAESGTSTGLGDMQFTAFYAPPSEGLLWGVGPIFAFPTGGEKRGSQKWSIGPSALAIKLTDTWIYGALVNNLWSYAGNSERGDVNQMLIQYFINYNFPTFYLTSAPIITANWNAPSGQEWTVPFGLGVGKLFRLGRLPLNCQVHYYNNVAKPDYGADWTLRMQVQVLLPKPGSK